MELGLFKHWDHSETYSKHSTMSSDAGDSDRNILFAMAGKYVA